MCAEKDQGHWRRIPSKWHSHGLPMCDWSSPVEGTRKADVRSPEMQRTPGSETARGLFLGSMTKDCVNKDSAEG